MELRAWVGLTRALVLLAAVGATWAAESAASAPMTVILLGTGTPYPDAARFGAAILVQAGGKKMVFDCGRAAVIRLKEARVNPSEIDTVFLTHLHSDHVVGLPDLWLTGWFLGRREPLVVWGPLGTREMMEHLRQAFAFDVRMREAPPESLPAQGVEIDAHEIAGETVYEKSGVRVSAFAVDHGSVKPAFGYRVDYGGHSVVISGDTRFSQNLIEHAKGADCVIHAAWSVGARNPTPPSQRSIASAEDVGRMFAAVRPKLGVIYHYRDEAGMAEAVRQEYKGEFVMGKDLMVIEVGARVKVE